MPQPKTKKQIITDNLLLIDEMTTVYEIDEHSRKGSVSTLDTKTKQYLYRACDVKEDEFLHRADALAVNGDLDDVE